MSPALRDAPFPSRLSLNLGSAGVNDGAATEKLQIFTLRSPKEQRDPQGQPVGISPALCSQPSPLGHQGAGEGFLQFIQAVPEPA